jgi:hypothetical protein
METVLNAVMVASRIVFSSIELLSCPLYFILFKKFEAAVGF